MAQNRYEIVFGANSSEFENTLSRLENESASSADAIASSFGMAGKLIGSYLSFTALKQGAETLEEFDDKIQKVGAVSSATAEQLGMIERKAKEMGAKTRFSATEAADGMQKLAMAGMDVDEIFGALPATLNAAAAEGIDLGTAADISTNVLAAFGGEVDQLDGYIDKLITTTTSSNSTLVEMGEAIKYSGPIAAALGDNISDVAAALGKMHDAGIKGTMAGTTVRGVLDALFNSTADEAAMLDELSSRIGGVGLQLKDSEGNFIGFTSLVRQLQQAGLTAGEALRLFGQRGGPGMAVLLSQGADSLEELEEKIKNSDGRSAELAAQMESGIGGASRRASAALEAGIIRVMREGEPLLKMFYESSEYISDVLDSVIGNAHLTAGALREIYAWAEMAVAPILALGGALSGGFDGANAVLDKMQEDIEKNFDSASESFDKAALNFSGMAGEVEKSQDTLATATSKTAKMFEEVSANTGEQIKSMEDLDAAVAAGAVIYDEAAGKWVSADAQKRASIEANSEIIKRANQAAVASARDAQSQIATISKDFISAESFEKQAENVARSFETAIAGGGSMVDAATSAYSKLTELHAKALKQNDEETAKYIQAEAEKYNNGSSQVLSLRAKMYEEILKQETDISKQLGGVLTDGLVEATRNAANARLDVIEASGGMVVDREQIVQNDVLELEKKSADQRLAIQKEIYEGTGELTEGYLDAVREAADKKAELWRNSGSEQVNVEEYVQSELEKVVEEGAQKRLEAEKKILDSRVSMQEEIASSTGEITSDYLSAVRAAAEEQVEIWKAAGNEQIDGEEYVQSQLDGIIADHAERRASAMAQVYKLGGVGKDEYLQSAKDAAEAEIETWVKAGVSREAAEKAAATKIKKLEADLANDVNKSIDSIKDNKTVTIDGDASGLQSSVDEAKSALNSLSSEAETAQMSAYDFYQQLSNSSVLLNPGEARRAMREIKSNAISDADEIRDARVNANKESLSSIKSDEDRARSELIDAQLHGTASAIKEAEDAYKSAIDERVSYQENAAKEEWNDYKERAKDAFEAQKEAAQNAAEAQKESLSEQLDAAKEQLKHAEDMQKAYYDKQKADLEEYYREVEGQRNEALDQAKQAAQEEYDYQENLLNKKIALLEKEKSLADDRLSTLKDIYDDSGEYGDEYYKAQADALAREAQEKKDSGESEILVEKWLQIELDKLRKKGLEEGITGLDQYSQAIIDNYHKTGEFSEALDRTNETIDALKKQLAQLKEEGADAFLNEIGATAQFDSNLASIQGQIDGVQEKIDSLNGDNFDLTGQTADSLASSVANAENNVKNLEAAIDSVDQNLENIRELKFRITMEEDEFVQQYLGQTHKKRGLHFLTGPSQIKRPTYSFEGGGYTGDGPRIGGTDGKGGFIAELHPQEQVIDMTKGGNKLGGDTYMTINSVNLVVKEAPRSIAQLKQDLSRLDKRTGLAR